MMRQKDFVRYSQLLLRRDHSCGTYRKFSEKLTFLTPYQEVRNVSFSETFASILKEWPCRKVLLSPITCVRYIEVSSINFPP